MSQPPDDSGAPDAQAAPTATVRTSRRSPISVAWLMPVIAIAIGGALLWRDFSGHGPTIRITFSAGNDLQADAPIKYRGVAVGKVRDVHLSEDLAHVEVVAEIFKDAKGLAVQGTDFWVVRPEISLTRISGLETLTGPRYIQCIPGTGAKARTFVGLDNPPPLGTGETGRDFILKSTGLGSIKTNVPVLYRDLQVGTVHAVQLASDARTVEVRIHIQEEYVPLVRANTRFWNASGFGVDVNLFGAKVKSESLESLLAGGIAFATPTEAGAPAAAGSIFTMAEKPEDDWLAWSPEITIKLPADAPIDSVPIDHGTPSEAGAVKVDQTEPDASSGPEVPQGEMD